MKYLLDTNTCIGAMRNHAVVVKHFAAVSPSDCSVSSITIYELFTGVEKCSDPTRERFKVELLLNGMTGHVFDLAAAREAARIRGVLEKAGNTIGPYDLLLAGHAIALGLILVTSNTSEFSRVSGLFLADWQLP